MAETHTAGFWVKCAYYYTTALLKESSLYYHRNLFCNGLHSKLEQDVPMSLFLQFIMTTIPEKQVN